MAHVKAHLSKRRARVARGERILISRDSTPMAKPVPPGGVQPVKREFGTGKGKARLIDPRALDPMSDEEAEAFLNGVIKRPRPTGHAGVRAR